MADELLYLGGKKSKLAEPEESEYLKLVGPKPAQFQNPLPSDNTIGRHLVEAAPLIGGVAGSFLPGGGTAAGAGLGALVKQELQKRFPEKLGAAPSGVLDIGADVGKEILLNSTAPWALGKLGGLLTQVGMHGPKAAAAINLSMLPATREGVTKRMAETINEHLGQNFKPLGDFQPLKFVEEKVPFQPISVTPGQDFQAFGKGKPFQMPTKPTVNASGPETQVPGGVIGRTLGTFKPGENKLGELVTAPRLDAEKTLAELTGENASRYADAMPPETYSAVKDMLGSMKEMQKKTVLDRIITYKQGRLVWGAGMGTLAAFGHPLAAAVGESPVILNSIMDRIMSNKETAQLVTAALRTSAKAPQADLINKALTVALPRLFLEGAGVDTTSGH